MENKNQSAGKFFETSNENKTENLNRAPSDSSEASKHSVEAFYSELSNLEIHWPGGGLVGFRDEGENTLNKMVHYQYPNWKTSGHVTSIPIARVPKIFLHNVKLSKNLQKVFNLTQKGEDGEMKVYKSLANDLNLEKEGLILLPNVDASHIFEKTSIGSVEIDMIVAHPSKGIFIFNVKNVKKISNDSIKKESLKHSQFVRHLANFGVPVQELHLPSSSKTPIDHMVPIHSVICYLPEDLPRLSELTKSTDLKANEKDQVLVFQKSDFQKTQESSFALHWSRRIKDIPNMSKESIKSFDRVVARLVAINSMEGAISLIHQKMVSNDMQSVKVDNRDIEKRLNDQLSDTFTTESEQSKDLKNYMKKIAQPDAKGNRVKVILWTKEQLEVIAFVFKFLTCSENENPLRLIVNGPMGSGKTMLMVYLARLLKLVFSSKMKVRISHGHGLPPQLLLEQIRAAIEGFDIEVLKESFFEVTETIQDGLVFVDEVTLTEKEEHKIGRNVHCCIFSPNRFYFDRIPNYLKDFKVLNLTSNLRSTQKLAELQVNFLSYIQDEVHLRGPPSHNLIGENNPEVVHVNKEESGSNNQNCFTSECINAIEKCMFRSHSTDVIAIPLGLLSPITQNIVVREMVNKDWRLQSLAFSRLDNDKLNSKPRNNLPLIMLENYHTLHGSEFGSVVLLIEKGCRMWYNDHDLAKVITRATTNLVIVVNHAPKLRQIIDPVEIVDSIHYL